MSKNSAIALVVSTIVLVVSISATADNWPRWRGPNFDGVAPAGDYPLQ